MTANLPDDEAARLAALREHHILDTAPEVEFDDIVRLAAQICGAPIAAVSLVDEHRQWFKAIIGLDAQETPRTVAFCAHTILQRDPLIIDDTRDDARFSDNPLVTGEPNIRFYAGVPLVTDEGHALGSLCVIDQTPRRLTPEQRESLRLLARQAASLLRAARRVAERERLILEREIAEGERLRLAAIVETCEDAIYSVTPFGRITSWNAAAERLYGRSAAEMIGRRIQILVPRERRVEIRAIVDAVREGREIAPLETAALRKNGHHVNVSIRISPIRDVEGAVAGLSCIARDISERKQTEAALQEMHLALTESEERLRRLTDAAFEGIAVAQDGMLVDASPAFAVLFGYESPAEMIGMWGGDLVALESRAMMLERVATCNEEPYEATLLRRDGSTFEAELRGRAIHIGGRIARVTAVRDITERKQGEELLRDHAVVMEFQMQELARVNAELEKLATTDGLTGLRNHRAFQERLAEEIGEVDRQGTSLSLILLDVDQFKKYNDHFGHPAGDEVLRTVSRLIQENVRDVDIAARYGGEEFVVILPRADLDSAAAIAERLRAAFEEQDWPLRSVTASFGVAVLQTGENGPDLIARADSALYHAKANGRNQVIRDAGSEFTQRPVSFPRLQIVSSS